jgi:hypothetical protein
LCTKCEFYLIPIFNGVDNLLILPAFWTAENLLRSPA